MKPRTSDPKSVFHLPDYAFRELRDLRAAGAGVILAHPERNGELCRRREIMLELFDSGVLFQVNAGSFPGVFGLEARASLGQALIMTKTRGG